MIKLVSPDGQTTATINQVGAALSQLWHKGLQVAGAPDIYSGVTLFPWPNRIFGGTWNNNGQVLTLGINDVDQASALHGLVFDERFEWIQTGEGHCSLNFELQASQGYPFQVNLEVDYKLQDGLVLVRQTVSNLASVEVPFAIGFHPYFKADAGSSFHSSVREFTLDAVQVDDTLGPELSSAILVTSDYRLELIAHDTEFIHIFTNRYSNKEFIWFAMEPQTSPADSLNSGAGVTRLKGFESKSFHYELKIS